MTTEPTATTVRPAIFADEAQIAELIAPFVVQGTVLPRTREEIRGLISTSFVAEVGDKLVGFAALEIYSKKLAEIRSLVVTANQQKHGVGRLLVEACVKLAARNSILEVLVVTSAEEFFLGCGFDFTLPGEKKALFIQPGTP